MHPEEADEDRWNVEVLMKLVAPDQMKHIQEYSQETGQPIEEIVTEAVDDYFDALVLKKLNDWEDKGCLRNVEADKNRHNRN